MIGIWVKTFTDNTQERGSDININRGKASWSKGRLDNIRHVTITEGFRMGQLQIEDTEWHQFDRLAVPVAEGHHKSTRTHRVVQAKIQSKHVGLFVDFRNLGTMSVCTLADKEPKPPGSSIGKIKKANVGMWLTIVLSYNEKPYVCISKHGKFEAKGK